MTPCKRILNSFSTSVPTIRFYWMGWAGMLPTFKPMVPKMVEHNSNVNCQRIRGFAYRNGLASRTELQKLNRRILYNFRLFERTLDTEC